MRKQSLLGTPLGTESILGDMKTNQPTTKLNSIEKELKDFDNLLIIMSKIKPSDEETVDMIKDFIRIALTKIQRETREKVIDKIRDNAMFWNLKDHDTVYIITTELLDKLKETK